MRGQESIAIQHLCQTNRINLPHEGSGAALAAFVVADRTGSTFPMRGQETKLPLRSIKQSSINLPHEGSGEARNMA